MDRGRSTHCCVWTDGRPRPAKYLAGSDRSRAWRKNARSHWQRVAKDVPLHLSRVSQDEENPRRCRNRSLFRNNPIDRAQDATHDKWRPDGSSHLAQRAPEALCGNVRRPAGSGMKAAAGGGMAGSGGPPAPAPAFAVRVDGTALPGAGIGMEGRLNSAHRGWRFPPPPRYITATSSHKCSTTPRSWEINRKRDAVAVAQNGKTNSMICA